MRLLSLLIVILLLAPLSGKNGSHAPEQSKTQFSDIRNTHPYWPKPGSAADFSSQVLEMDTIHVEWIQTYASGLGPPNEEATGITVDASGNVYVTCFSSNPLSPGDIQTFKYSAAGSVIWSARYNGPDDLFDYPGAIAVDVEGNVYVAGYSVSMTTSFDFLLLKYASNGVLLWERRYNGEGDSVDGGFMIGLRSNAVVVCGVSMRGNGMEDIVAVKYNSDGQRQWVTKYEGPVYTYTEPSDMILDSDGNVYIAGEIESFYEENDLFLALKISPNGNLEWASQLQTGYLYGGGITGMTLDSNDDVYISGYIYGEEDNEDFLTVKFSNSGTQQWFRRYSGEDEYSYDQAEAIAADDMGYVYVTGTVDNPETDGDITTIKYNSDGEEIWIKNYSGDYQYSDDEGYDIAVDGNRNVYVLGQLDQSDGDEVCLIIKYDSDGEELWASTFNASGEYDYPRAIVLDPQSNVYMLCETELEDYSDRMVTSKFNASGVRQWAVEYVGPGSSGDEPFAMAMDAGGNIYVGAQSNGANGREDFLILKYSPSGNLEWSDRYDSEAGDEDYFCDLEVDPTGNVFMTGYTEFEDWTSEIVVMKYNSGGVRQWVKTYQGVTSEDGEVYDLETDQNGNVIILGREDYSKMVTIKYNPEGEEQWAVPYPADPADLVVDGSGNVYVAGSEYVSGQSDNYVVLKYNPSGGEVWKASFGGPGSSYDEPLALFVDKDQNVYVTGTIDDANEEDFATVKFDSDGKEAWSAFYDGPFHSEDRARSVIVDEEGNVYVVGESENEEGWDVLVVIKYDSQGNDLWMDDVHGQIDYDIHEKIIGFDESGFLYISGAVENLMDWEELLVTAYDPDGNRQFYAHYGAPGFFENTSKSMLFGEQGSVYLLVELESSNDMIGLIKFAPGPAGIKNEISGHPFTFTLEQNYPNPFNALTTIEYSLPVRDRVTVSVYDVRGRKIVTLLDDVQSAGNNSLRWNAGELSSGIYFYTIQVAEQIQTKRMLLLK